MLGPVTGQSKEQVYLQIRNIEMNLQMGSKLAGGRRDFNCMSKDKNPSHCY